MKLRFLSLMIILGLLVGCQNETDVKVLQSNCSILASIESAVDESRTAVDDAGNVTWIKTDAIGVFGSVTKNAQFTSTGDGASVTFEGSLSVEGEEIACVYYPYDETASLQANELTFTLPAEYTYTGASCAPMLGVKNENDGYNFKHLCGLMRVSITGVPEGTSTFTLVSEGENAPGIAGTAVVNDIYASDATLELNESLSNQITVTIQTDEMTNATLYLPLPVGTYSKLSVTYKDETTEYFKKSTSNVTINRSMLLDMPVVAALDEDVIVEEYLDRVDDYIQSLKDEPYSDLKDNLIAWLNEQDYIEEVNVYSGGCHDELALTFAGNLESSIGFIVEQEVDNAFSRGVSDMDKTVQVSYNEGEKILYNTKVKVYDFLGGFNDDERQNISNVVGQSPIKFAAAHALKDRTHAIEELVDGMNVNGAVTHNSEYGTILLCDTHGKGYGVFRVLKEGNENYLKNEKLNNYYYDAPIYMIGGNGKLYSKVQCLGIYPTFFKDKIKGRKIVNDSTIIYGSYCWSAVGPIFPNLHDGIFIGYLNKSHVGYNSEDLWDYYHALFNGMTHKDAFALTKENQAIDNTNVLYSSKKDSKLRYFSISTDSVVYGMNSWGEYEAHSVNITGKINGIENLKTGSNGISPRLYWREGKEKFTSPWDEGVVIEKQSDLNNSGFLGTNFDFDVRNGKFRIFKNKLKPNTTYQFAIGFAYGSKYYFGDVKEHTTGGNPDRESLIELYNNFNGESWENKTNWCTDNELYRWDGVRSRVINGEERVTKLVIDETTTFTGILDLTKFTYLESLCIRNVNLSLLDVSNLLYLKQINDPGFMPFTQKENDIIQELNASGCIRLNDMHVPDNTYYINISGCIGYKKQIEGWGGGNNIQKIDASGCLFTHLDLRKEKSIKDLILTNCTKLVYFTAENSGIETLDLTNCINLKQVKSSNTNLLSVNLKNCSNLQEVNCSNTQLNNINLTNCSNLQQVNCSNTQLNNIIGIRDCANLQIINFNITNLSSLNLSDFKNLSSFECENSNLSSLNLNGCTKLDYLSVRGNNLTHLDFTTNEMLRSIDCSDNPIAGTLDLSNNIRIGFIEIQNTNFSTLNIDTKKRGAYFICIRTDNTKLKDIYVHNRAQILYYRDILWGYAGYYNTSIELWGNLFEKNKNDHKHYVKKTEIRKDQNNQNREVDLYSEYPEVHFTKYDTKESYQYYY